MTRDNLGLPQPHAADTLIARLCRRAENGKVFHADRKLFAEAAEALASAEAAGTIAAARLAAEEMRERAAKVCEAESLKPAYREWEGGYYSGFHDAADIIRHLPLPPSSPEDQEKAKAAAIPTIADPDGEARS